MKSIHKYQLPIAVFSFVGFMLSIIQLKVETSMLLLERFFVGGGWLEIVIVSMFGFLLAFKMQGPKQLARWRRLSWTIFSV